MAVRLLCLLHTALRQLLTCGLAASCPQASETYAAKLSSFHTASQTDKYVAHRNLTMHTRLLFFL